MNHQELRLVICWETSLIVIGNKARNGMREGVNFGCLRDNLPRANLPRKMQPLSQKQANDNWNFCRNL